MFGFAVGALFIGALAMAFKAGRRRAYGRRRRRGHWSRRTWMMRRLFNRLDTSPDQEAAIEGALRELFDTMHAHRADLATLREELASTVTADSLDDENLTPIFARVDEVTTKTKEAAHKALTSIHETLGAEQRQALAEMLRNPRGRGRWADAHPVQF